MPAEIGPNFRIDPERWWLVSIQIILTLTFNIVISCFPNLETLNCWSLIVFYSSSSLFHTAEYILIVIWFSSVISIELFYPQCDKLQRETGERGPKVLWKDAWAWHPSVCRETSTWGLQRGCTAFWSTFRENSLHGSPQARKKPTFEGNRKKVKIIDVHNVENLI